MPKFDINQFDLPTHFSRRVQNAIDIGTLADPEDSNRAAFVRETVAFYEPILPNPTPSQYEAISRRIVDKYSCLKDAKTSKYWVGNNVVRILCICYIPCLYWLVFVYSPFLPLT